METFNLAKHSRVIYRYNPETKYFHQSEIERRETPLNRLPLEMRIAPAGAMNVKPNASKLLLSRECNKGKYSFITGLQETIHKGWFIGNDYEYYKGQKILSLILFHFVDEQTIVVYYFYQYDKPNTFYRMQFANGIIPQLIQKVSA